MKAPAEYLEAAKVEELAEELRSEGYEVAVNPTGPDQGFDLIASKGKRKIAYEVRALPKLAASVSQMRQLRQRARELGYDDVKLIVVPPPREVAVEVAGLEDELFDHLSNETPKEIDLLATTTRVEGIRDVEIGRLEISESAIHVEGSAVVDVLLVYGTGEGPDGTSWTDSYPLYFDVDLDFDRRIQHVHSLRVDTSSFYE